MKMRRALVLIAVVGVLLVSACSSSSSGAATLEPQAFADAAAKPGVVLLDVRTPEEFAAGHLPGAVNVNVEDAGFADALATLDTQATYAVYCQSGRRSAVAASRMADAGFGSIVVLEGGVESWLQGGGSLTTQ